MIARDKASLLRPLGPQRNRAEEVVDRIACEIRGGRLTPGERLPTEHALMSAMGVSRTVVREAVAALRAEGLVVTRQGSGAFVAPDARRAPFRIEAVGAGQIDGVIALMELRLAVEVEAAALTAERATAAAIRKIAKAVRAIDAAIGRNEAAVVEDFSFHKIIAEATGNPLYLDFLTFLGHHIIPRQSVRVAATQGDEQKAYLERIQQEHRQIAAAIRERDAEGARAAMRGHLDSSLARYRRLAAQSSGIVEAAG